MEILGVIAILAIWLAPIVLLLVIATNKGRSAHFAWWGVGLSWLGFFVGAIIMLLGPTLPKPPQDPARQSWMLSNVKNYPKAEKPKREER